MGGLANLFRKLIPITLLICLISFGIAQIFTTNGLTYISTITNTDGISYTKFDFAKYIKNINTTYIKDAVTNVIDVKGLQQQLNQFKKIWNDGYDLGDGIKTIIGVIILVIDLFITFLNMLFVPIRLIAGLILTALNIVGINTNTSSPIINLLKMLLNLHRTTKNGIEPLIPLIKWNIASTETILVTTVPVVPTYF